MLGFSRKKIPAPNWDETGVSALSEVAQPIKIAWEDVSGIFAYKKDCFAVDQIRLIITSKDWQIEFTEDDPTFDKLRDHINNIFTIASDWHTELVVSPAFELMWAVVYSMESKFNFKELK